MSGLVTTGEGLPVTTPEAPAPADVPTSPPPIEETPERDKRRRRAIYLLLLLLSLLIVLIGIVIWYFLFRQPIVIPPPNLIDLPGYSTSIYGADGPMGVAANPDGSRIYVAQTGGDRSVAIFDASGTLVGNATPPEATGAEHVPVWLALDPLSSELYVSDRPTGEVYVFDRDGAYIRTFAPVTPIAGWQPLGVAFDKDGNLYVADLASINPRVEKFDRSGNLLQTFGEADRMSFPNGVAVDAAGNVFVADSNNGRLLAYRPDGTLIAQVGRGVAQGELGMPRGVAVDGRGRIYVGDTTAQGVAVMQLNSGTGQLESLGFLGGPGIEDGRFTFPNGVAADGRGRLYIADTSNNRIQLWSY